MDRRRGVGLGTAGCVRSPGGALVAWFFFSSRDGVFVWLCATRVCCWDYDCSFFGHLFSGLYSHRRCCSALDVSDFLSVGAVIVLGEDLATAWT